MAAIRILKPNEPVNNTYTARIDNDPSNNEWYQRYIRVQGTASDNILKAIADSYISGISNYDLCNYTGEHKVGVELWGGIRMSVTIQIFRGRAQ